MSKRAKSSPGRHIPKPSEIGRETVHYTTRRSNRCRGSELRLMEIVVGTRPGVQLGGHGSRRDGVLVLPFGKGTSHGPGAGWLQATRPHGSSFHDRSVAALEKGSQSEAFANSVGYAQGWGQIYTREWQSMAASGRSDRGIDSEAIGAGEEG